MGTEQKKTKAELYLERLEKWRAEKQQKAASVKKGPVVKTERKDVTRKETVRKVPPRQSLQLKSTKPSLHRASLSVRQSQLGAKKINRPTPPKVLHVKSVSNEDQEKMVDKLQKWRRQNEIGRSAQKRPAPTSTSKSVQPSSKCGKFVSVKSRLFDYQHKPATTTAAKTEKENRVTGTTTKTFKSTRPTAQKRETLKRRHSEALQEPPMKKPVSILKRKSCIGSFDMTKGDKSDKNKRQSGAKDKLNLKSEGVEDEVFACNTEEVNPCSSSRNVRFATPVRSEDNQGRELRKTPKPSHNKSQELSDWLKAKGRTPSKFRHLLCFHDEKDAEAASDPCTKMSLTVDELSEQMDVIETEQQEAEARAKLDVMLEECMTLFEAGCPTEAIIPWLDSIYNQIPIAKSAASFYICKAAVVKTTHDLDAVLQVFEDATINDAQPKEAIAKCLTETIKYVTEEKIKKVKRRSRSQRRSLVQEENVFESSSVVYVVSEATPISEGKRGRKRPDTPATNSSCKVITPVRRSTRRSLQNLPESLKDNKEKFASLKEVDERERDKFLFQPNLALDKVLAAADEEEENAFESETVSA